MTSTSFMPPDDYGKADLIEHLAATLPKYNGILKPPPELLTQVSADALAFRFTLHTSDDSGAFSQHWTTFKNRLRDGGDGTGDWPQPFVVSQPVPAAVSTGVIPRLRSLVAWIKAQPGYTDEIGQDLRIVPPSSVVDPESWKPDISLQLKAAHPNVNWTKGKANALEIWVDRGDGKGFVLLTISTSPPTLDNSPLPAPGSSAIWKYKAIYRYHDQQVGQWSDVVSITVSG